MGKSRGPMGSGHKTAANVGLVVLAVVVAGLVGFVFLSPGPEAQPAAGTTFTPQAPTSATPAKGDALTLRGQIIGQAVRLDMPMKGKPKALALWFHGQNGNVDTRMNEAWLNTLRSAGWAVASSAMDGNAWGAAPVVADTAALAKWAETKAGTPVQLVVSGSMGSLNALTAMAAKAVTPRCWYGVMPVVDITTATSVPDATAEIGVAYGSQIPHPLTKASGLPAITYRVLASPADTWVPKAKNADYLAQILPSDATFTARAVSGQHGDPSHFDGGDLAKFAAGCQ